MCIARALAKQDETVLYGGEDGIGIVGHVGFHLVGYDAAAFGGAGVGSPYLQVVLMAVLGEDEQFVGVAAELDAGDVAFGLQRYFHLTCGTALDVEGVHRYLAVGLSGNGILVFVGTWILGILLHLGQHALVHGEGEQGHLALVVADPCQHGGIGIEVEAAVGDELLFVHPVGLAVDDAVELTVLGDLYLGIVEEQFHKEEVAFAHETHHVAVGAPEGALLRTAIGKGRQGAVLYIIYIIYGGGAMTVDATCLCAQKYVLLVG